jgi:peptide/nickel transport system permease protein
VAAADTTVLVLGGGLSRFRGRLRELRLPWIPLIVLTVILVCAIFANIIAPHDPRDNNIRSRLRPPFTEAAHPLGTDVLGKDILSRLIFGARTTLQVTAPAMIVAIFVGTTIGLVSGYAGRWVDSFLMRISDAVLGFPSILVALLIVTLLGTGIWNVVIAVTATQWARFARMIRGEVLATRERDFVLLARIFGVSPTMIVWRHIFPNVVNTLMVLTSVTIGQVILLEASLSFLGLGLKPGDPAWGIMVAEGRKVLVQGWWIALIPGLVITGVVMAFNFFGDWLRDYLDPKLRRAR